MAKTKPKAEGHKHQVGDTVQFVLDDDHADDPAAALITKVHESGRVFLAYWCSETHTWKEAVYVPHLRDADGDTGESYFICKGEA